MSRAVVLFFISLSLLLFGACDKKQPVSKVAPATASQAAAQQEAEVKAPKVEEEVYVYDKKNKRDPFVSLIVTTPEKSVKGETPFESYDITTMKVIAIVRTEKGNYAEIVLPDGKSYTVKEGMKIRDKNGNEREMTFGIHAGKIEQITKDSIVFKELVKDYKGEIKPKRTILRLREEEE